MSSQNPPASPKVSRQLIRRKLQETDCERKTLKAEAHQKYENFVAATKTIPEVQPSKIIELRLHTIVKTNMWLDAQYRRDQLNAQLAEMTALKMQEQSVPPAGNNWNMIQLS